MLFTIVGFVHSHEEQEGRRGKFETWKRARSYKAEQEEQSYKYGRGGRRRCFFISFNRIFSAIQYCIFIWRQTTCADFIINMTASLDRFCSQGLLSCLAWTSRCKSSDRKCDSFKWIGSFEHVPSKNRFHYFARHFSDYHVMSLTPGVKYYMLEKVQIKNFPCLMYIC